MMQILTDFKRHGDLTKILNTFPFFFFFLPKVLFLCKTLFLFCKLTSFLSYYRYIIVVFLIFHLLTRYYAFVIFFFH